MCWQRRCVVAVALACAVIALVACDDSPADPPADAQPTPTTVATAPPGRHVVIATDLPLQGASEDMSADTNLAVRLILEQAGGRAAAHTVVIREYDNTTAASGPSLCTANANAHVQNAAEVAVMGTYNSGCAKLEIPILNQDPSGPMLMISHANTNPGITKAWDPGEPDIFYPTGTRNYGRIIATDDFQGKAGAEFAAELGLKNCYVLNDAQTYGRGLAKTFVDAAAANGITIIANDGWDAKQPNYTALFEKVKAQNPDCVYLGGINDNNGQQLILDKVKVLGPNDGAVKLVTPDGFTGYPELRALTEAQGMYITVAGLSVDVFERRGGAAADFIAAFRARYGHAPASSYAIYGAAVMQLLLKAVAASDGTRNGVRDAAFSGLVVPAAESVLGREFGIDPDSGDTTLQEGSILRMAGGVESFLRPWALP